jgi:Protein of unknown function (DUF3300)
MNNPKGVVASAIHRWLVVTGVLCLILHGMITAAQAQDTTEQQAAATEGPQLLTPEELRVVVAPIAFYPDEVLAVVLPASTTGLQLVEAQRFLEKHKTDSSLQPDKDWDPSVVALINYPDVVERLNADLDWTQRLGDAVLDQQADVMDAIQQARNEAVAAGYLKSDDKQVINQEKETVVIQSANPEVVYVPTYDPQVVVQQSYASYPPPAYYPPYQPYYAPAATFFAGAITGAAFAYAFNWNDNDIDINGGWGGGNNVNINTGDINVGNRVDADKFNGDRTRVGDRDQVKWNGNKQRQKRDTAAGKRRGEGAAQLRPAGVGDNKRPGAGANNRPGGANKQRAGEQAGARNKGTGFGNQQGGRQTAKQSKRGSQSLQSGSGAGVKKQQRAGGGASSGASMSKKRQGGAGAFGGQGGGGKKAGAQSKRGNQSMQGKPKRKR